MKIYFSYPTSEFDTCIEQEHLNIIKNVFNNYIIENPKNIKIPKNDLELLKNGKTGYISMMEKWFYPQIENSDALIAFGDSNGNISNGVKKEIEHANLKNIPVTVKVGNDWKKRNEEFYKNTSVFRFLTNYFNVKKGVRYIVGHTKHYTINNHEMSLDSSGRLIRFKPNRYIYKPSFRKMKTISMESLINNNCTFSYQWIFDKRPLSWYPALSGLPGEATIGVNAVLDLDAPTIGNTRQDIFDWIPEFDKTISDIDKILKYEFDSPIKYNLMFSGNGIYFILNGYYNKKIDDYKENLENLIIILNHKLKNNKVTLDNTKAPWSSYFKIPFTFHEKKKRISCPIPKGKLDAKWLKEHTDVNKIMKDYSLIDEIIKDAKWEKLW